MGGHSLMAGESKTASPKVETAQEDEATTNWINLSLGGPIVGGDTAQFRAVEHTSSNLNGGIEDMHYEKQLGKKVQLTLDGHAIFDASDYKFKLELSQADLGYFRAGYTQFRTWYDGNGGNLPTVSSVFPDGQFFSPANNSLALDRGDIWVELGIRTAALPEITIRYDHIYRYGQKDSTEWGTAYLNNNYAGSTAAVQRKAMPTFYDIQETRDIVTFDAKKTVFGNTDLGIGMRYEYNKNNDSLNQNNQGNLGYANQTWLTQVNQNDLNMYTGHYSTVTRFNDSLWLTTAYSYSSIDSNTGGSRISGTTGNNFQFDPLHPVATVFTNLNGSTVTDQQVINLNVMWVPIKDLSITPALRIGIEDAQSNSPYITTGTSLAVTGTNMLALSSNHYNEIEQSLDIRYTGIDNILLYARGNWDERTGGYDQSVSFGTNTNGVAVPKTGTNSINQNIGTTYLQQKYAIGSNWYPRTNLSLALQYYYQIEQSEFNWAVPGNVNGGIPKAGTNAGVIAAEQLITNDINARVTWRPCSGVSLVTRYDMQYVTMDNSGFGGSNAAGAALVPSIDVGEVQSAKITNNMFTESITWTPLARLYVQGNASYVLSQTSTPANYNLSANGAAFTSPTVLNFNNNYVELGCDVGFVLDDKTDLTASYNYFRACDYTNNITVGMPYGAGTIENTVTAGIVRKLTKNVSVSLKYSYTSYSDQTSGYNNNYTANMIYSGLQFKF